MEKAEFQEKKEKMKIPIQIQTTTTSTTIGLTAEISGDIIVIN